MIMMPCSCPLDIAAAHRPCRLLASPRQPGPHQPHIEPLQPPMIAGKADISVSGGPEPITQCASDYGKCSDVSPNRRDAYHPD